jgi:hypothetical protein
MNNNKESNRNKKNNFITFFPLAIGCLLLSAIPAGILITANDKQTQKEFVEQTLDPLLIGGAIGIVGGFVWAGYYSRN